VRSYIASKALRYGAKMLRVKLFAKGAEKAIVDELLFEAGADGEELLIRKAYAEALRRKEDLGDFKIRQRWIQRLLRRGCSFERVRSFLDGIQSSYSD
jgi:SOS response regulatory protein OraA/RecX